MRVCCCGAGFLFVCLGVFFIVYFMLSYFYLGVFVCVFFKLSIPKSSRPV